MTYVLLALCITNLLALLGLAKVVDRLCTKLHRRIDALEAHERAVREGYARKSDNGEWSWVKPEEKGKS